MHIEFNIETALDATLFASMGVAIALLWGTMMMLTVLLMHTAIADRALA